MKHLNDQYALNTDFKTYFSDISKHSVLYFFIFFWPVKPKLIKNSTVPAKIFIIKVNVSNVSFLNRNIGRNIISSPSSLVHYGHL